MNLKRHGWILIALLGALAALAVQSCGKADGSGVGGKVIITGAGA